MFEKIINALKSRVKPPFDPAVLNDRVALLTEWTPLVRGGANFKTHKLVQVYAGRYEFRAGAGMKAFSAVFAVMGLFFASVSIGLSINQKDFPLAAGIFMSLFGLLFFFIGIGIYWFSSTPRVFDKDMGFYWKGRSDPNLMVNPEYQNCTKLSDIYAVQIISERVSGNKSSYTSYEFNLVLKDGKRINAVDHGNYDAVRQDAETIASFLNIPVWDATINGQKS
jgi:hypothetical protein